MELVRDTPFEVAHFAFQARPGTPVRTVVVKATYALVPSGECTIASTQRFPTGELYHDDDVQQSLRHPDDLAPFKPRGECFVLGHFHAPHGQPVPHGRIAFQIGPVQKALSVFGERRWTTWGPSEPKPTARVPLRWERAFGGPNVPENPVGCGAETVPQLEDATRLLTSPRDRVPPACTAPLNRTWPVRAKLVGTYDREWLATAYPFLAADVRLEYFCAAPPDQRLEGHWRGDETIVLVNIVPEWPHVHCRLPGLWPRAAWVTTDAPGYRAEVREIPLVLDTLTVDGDAREVHAVWRCTTAEPTDCTHLVVFHHRLGETVDLGRAAVALIERQREAEAEAQAEAPPVDARASMAPPSVVPPSVAPPSVTAPSVADAAARQAQRGDLAGVSASVAGQLARGLEASAPAARPLDETKLAELEAREAAARDRWMRSVASRRELERAVASGESCAGLDLSELDLSDLRLENADLSGANLRGTLLRGAMLSRVSLDGAILDGADVSGARFVAVSMLEASLVECQGLGARLEDCNLRDAVLERASWPRVHFQRVRAQGAILRGATASECWFEECDLTHADFGEATVESTLFTRCDASDAHFGEGAILKRARFEQCRLQGLRAFEAECEELSLTESMAERARFGASKLARARFLAVNLERADFSKADLTEAAFGRCHLRKARLDEAKLERAQLLSADLYQARLENADLRNADLRGANLFQAELLGARLEGARLDLANLTGTRLEAR